LMCNPSKPLICVDATVSAAAEQNPPMTGVEMNSIITPIHMK
jgi:hypothetical protein